MPETIFDEGATLICIQSFNYNGKTVPAETKYNVKETETVPVNEEKPHVVQSRHTLEIVDDDVPQRVCKTLQVEGEEITDKFQLEGFY